MKNENRRLRKEIMPLDCVKVNSCTVTGSIEWKQPNSWSLIQGTPIDVSLFQ